MNMVLHYFQFYNFKPVLLTNFFYQLFRSFPHLLPLKYFLPVFRTPHQMVTRVVDRMTRSFYRHALLISHFPARAYVDKGDSPVPLIYPLGKACIHPARQAAGNSAKVLVKTGRGSPDCTLRSSYLAVLQRNRPDSRAIFFQIRIVT